MNLLKMANFKICFLVLLFLLVCNGNNLFAKSISKINSGSSTKIHSALISLGSGQMIHKYTENTDSISSKKIFKEIEEVIEDTTTEIIPSKLGRLKSEQDTSVEEIPTSKIAISTPQILTDSAKNELLKPVKKFSKLVATLGITSSVLALQLYQKRQKEIRENKNIEPKEDDYKFGFIIMLCLLMLFLGSKMTKNWRQLKSFAFKKLSWVDQLILKIALFYHLGVGAFFTFIVASIVTFFTLYITVVIPLWLLIY